MLSEILLLLPHLCSKWYMCGKVLSFWTSQPLRWFFHIYHMFLCLCLPVFAYVCVYGGLPFRIPLRVRQSRFTSAPTGGQRWCCCRLKLAAGHQHYQRQLVQVVEKKSWKGDTLGPVELFVWPEQGNQGDWHEQDDQDEVSIIIFGMSKSSGFQKYSICWVFQALCLCLCICNCHCLCICALLWFLNSLHRKLSEYVWL